MTQNKEPMRLGIIGLTHSHVGGVLNDKDKPYKIIGIVESDRKLAERMSKRFGFSMDIVFDSMEEFYNKVKPEAVACFNATYYHLETVRFFAPKGIHIMVEKPLAATLEQAEEMAKLAHDNKIHLLTNYETTWYGSIQEAYKLIQSKDIGEIRKTVFRDGHTGPVERNRHPEMVPWVRDPKLNGGGVVMDFGCYGANIMTWLMNNEKPLSITAAFQTIKPEQYPQVEDQATVILTYPKAQCIIEASWNFPINMKTMDVYGKNGYVLVPDNKSLFVKTSEDKPQEQSIAVSRKVPYNNPFTYFCAVVKEGAEIDPQSSLENNLIVMEILEAAKQSAKENKTVFLSKE